MTEDIIVELEGGIYQLDSALRFSSVHSGTNGYRVIIRSKANQLARISGGIPVTGWVMHDDEKNIVKASVPDGFIFRQLYVNDAKMPRAEYKIDGNNQIFATTVKRSNRLSFLISGDEVATKGIPFSENTWNNLKNVEIRFHTTYRKHKAQIDYVDKVGTDLFFILTSMVTDIMSNNRTVYSNTQAYDISFENAYEFIDESGEWYLDHATNTVYYKLKSNETVDNISVIAPNLERLIDINGTYNLCFFGLSFEHSTWLYPTTNGCMITEESYYTHEVYTDTRVVPAAVYASGASRLQFERNIWRFNGGSGLFVDDNAPAHNLMITGNVFYQTAASAINLCRKRYNPPQTNPKTAIYQPLINNNYFYETAYEYGTNVFAGHYAYQLEFTNNEVYKCTNMAVGLGHGSSIGNLYRFNVKNNIFDSCAIEGTDIGVIHIKYQSDGSRIVENVFNNTIKVASKRGMGKYYASINDPFAGNIYLDNLATDINCIRNLHKNTSWNGYEDRMATNDQGTEFSFESGKHIYHHIGGKPGTGLPNYFIDDYKTLNASVEAKAGLSPEYSDIKTFVSSNFSSNLIDDKTPSDLHFVSILADDRDEDTEDYQITYSGSWSEKNENGENLEEGSYRSTYTTTTSDNAEVVVRFKGSKIEVIAPKNNEQGVMEVFIDDVSKGEVNLFSDTYQWQESVFSIEDLSEALHVLKLKKKSGSKLIVDGFEIQKCGTSLLYQQLTPEHGGEMDAEDNLEILFNKNVQAKESRYRIIIYEEDGTIHESIASTDTEKVSIDGNRIIINPDRNFEVNKQYSVSLTEGLFEDAEGNLSMPVDKENWVFSVMSTNHSPYIEFKGTLSIYPNPANNSICLSSGKEIRAVTLSSLDGKHERTETVSGSSINIDINNLKVGLYIINALMLDSQMAIGRFIKY